MARESMASGTKKYVFLWYIENYSYCWQKVNEVLESPIFTTDSLEGTAWSLNLYPRGESDESECWAALKLARCKDDNGPRFITIHYELAFLKADGEILDFEENKERFEKNGRSIQYLFMTNKVLWAACLPQDTLIVRCEIWSDSKNEKPATEITARTRIGIEHVSFYHKIDGFSKLQTYEKKNIEIRCHSKRELAISSSLSFNDGPCCGEKIILGLTPSHEQCILSKRKLHLMDASGNLIPCGEADNRFDDEREDITQLALTLTRRAILKNKSTYLPKDQLSLLCECVFSTGEKYDNTEKTLYGMSSVELNQVCNSTNNMDIYTEQLSTCPSALDDFKTIFENRFQTDVELVTESKSFPAHNVVLCARSSVFKAMLGNDMKEKNTSRIQIDDLEDDIIQKFLLFLYSDVLEPLDWDTAIKLYYAGDKYAIAKLKLLCSSFLVKNLSTSSVVELLLLADTHNDSDLKKTVVDFILKHEEQIYGSQEWRNLIKINSVLVSETMCQKYKREL